MCTFLFSFTVTLFPTGALEIFALAAVGGKADKGVDRGGAGARFNPQMTLPVFWTFLLFT